MDSESNPENGSGVGRRDKSEVGLNKRNGSCRGLVRLTFRKKVRVSDKGLRGREKKDSLPEVKI